MGFLASVLELPCGFNGDRVSGLIPEDTTQGKRLEVVGQPHRTAKTSSQGRNATIERISSMCGFSPKLYDYITRTVTLGCGRNVLKLKHTTEQMGSPAGNKNYDLTRKWRTVSHHQRVSMTILGRGQNHLQDLVSKCEAFNGRRHGLKHIHI